MPHSGRPAPLWNPARPWLGPNAYPGQITTEFTFSVPAWTGLDSFGMPLSGRGIGPVPWSDSATPPWFYTSLVTELGASLQFGFQLALATKPGRIVCNLFCERNGVAQVTMIDQYDLTDGDFRNLVFAEFIQYQPVVGALCAPSGTLVLQPVKWSASPVPASSYPF